MLHGGDASLYELLNKEKLVSSADINLKDQGKIYFFVQLLKYSMF